MRDVTAIWCTKYSASAHTASLEHDYTELLGEVRQAKQIQAIDGFITGKIKETYIKIDPLFQDCEFELEEWKSKFTQEN